MKKRKIVDPDEKFAAKMRKRGNIVTIYSGQEALDRFKLDRMALKAALKACR